MSDDRQLVSTVMDSAEGQVKIVTRNSRITAITLDSLNGYEILKHPPFQMQVLMAAFGYIHK